MRIGLYGGCFNPVHQGHLSAARGARDRLGLDQLIFIPSGTPPLKTKTGLAEGSHRLAMLELATADDPALVVSPVETDRDGPSYTLDSVRALRNSLPAQSEFFFLLGDDCVERLPRWKGIDELHSVLRFVILPRSRASLRLADDRLISLPLQPVPVSSTQIRAMLAAGIRPPETLLPPSVTDYIMRHGLFTGADEASCA